MTNDPFEQDVDLYERWFETNHIAYESELCAVAGLEIGTTGAIKVDPCMRTSDPDMYAAGDCVECVDLLTGKPCFVPLGSTANKQGRVAANNIVDSTTRFPVSWGVPSAKCSNIALRERG